MCALLPALRLALLVHFLSRCSDPGSGACRPACVGAVVPVGDALVSSVAALVSWVRRPLAWREGGARERGIQVMQRQRALALRPFFLPPLLLRLLGGLQRRCRYVCAAACGTLCSVAPCWLGRA